MPFKVRRVVTGLDAQGRSRVLFDSPIEGNGSHVFWKSEETPASNEGDTDCASTFDLAMVDRNGSNFIIVELPADRPPMMHATSSLDYVIVLSGRILLTLETETVELNTGDVVVDRGVLHGWSALDGKPAVLIAASVPAHPLGAGSRVIG